MSIEGIEIRFRSRLKPGQTGETLEQTVVVPLVDIICIEGLHPTDAMAIVASKRARQFWQAVVMNGAFDDIME